MQAQTFHTSRLVFSRAEDNLVRGTKWTDVEKQSTMETMIVLPWNRGKPVTKSTAMCDQGQWGTGKGCNKPAGGWWDALLCFISQSEAESESWTQEQWPASLTRVQASGPKNIGEILVICLYQEWNVGIFQPMSPLLKSQNHRQQFSAAYIVILFHLGKSSWEEGKRM